MSGDGRGSKGRGTRGPARDRRLLLLTPLSVEALAARDLDGARVLRTGMGPERARRAVPRARAERADAVAVAGFCGALTDGLAPGDVVVATEVLAPDGRRIPCSSGPLVAALRRLGVDRVHLGPVASVDHVVGEEERPALAARGAVAVDMESAWLAEAAQGRPFAVLRAVVDAPGRDLSRPLATLRGGAAAYRSLRRALPALLSWARAAGPRRVLLAGPRSFCAGVERAIEIVERALDRYGPPVYVRKQIVHNVHVVRDLERRGAVFVDELDEVPEGSLVVFSAHGVSPQVRQQAVERNLNVIDATCPLVTKVHAEARRFARHGFRIVLIGHAGHEEVEGTTGEAPQAITLIGGVEEAERLPFGEDEKVAYLTQTTLAVDEVEEVVEVLRRRFPQLRGPGSDDICYATSNRQDAVKALARECDLLLVIGSDNSSNSRRLVEVSEREGCRARLLDDETEVDPEWLVGVRTVGITAGASAPEVLVRRVVEALGSLGPVKVEERRVTEESMQFTLPIELRTSER
ncbi:MAG TPA: 4-hydroxy-3-methylbut-2-enyl diphosphate reductase [Actinomycetota bacterium]|nr:4-hydroxy-3-methylbut-2-enyl diphosphate reductase [Actinomycetota bacterium]